MYLGQVRKLALILAAGVVVGGASPAHAAILLNGSTDSGTGTYPTAITPYAVPTDAIWNRGGTAQFANVVNSDGTAAGVTVVNDYVAGVSATNNSTLDFVNAPSTTANGGSTTSADGNRFGVAPGKDFFFSGGSGGSSGTVGLAGMRVSGLAPGTYDIYIAAAYTGSTSANRVGGTNPSQQAVWIFTGSANAIDYDPTANTLGGVARTDLLENTSKSTWTNGDNYALATVTITPQSPSLFIASSGANTAISGTNGDVRAFINFVQIVPEPSSFGLLLGGVMLVLRARRRA